MPASMLNCKVGSSQKCLQIAVTEHQCYHKASIEFHLAIRIGWFHKGRLQKGNNSCGTYILRSKNEVSIQNEMSKILPVNTKETNFPSR